MSLELVTPPPLICPALSGQCICRGVFDHFLNEKQRGRTPHNTVQHLEWGGAWALTSPWV